MKSLEGTYVALCADPVEELGEVGEALSRLGCQVEGVETPEQLWALLDYCPVDLIVVHICGPSSHFLEALSSSGRGSTLPPILAVACSEEYYLNAIKLGAFDCIALPLDEKELARIAELAVNSRSPRAALPATP